MDEVFKIVDRGTFEHQRAYKLAQAIATVIGPQSLDTDIPMSKVLTWVDELRDRARELNNRIGYQNDES